MDILGICTPHNDQMDLIERIMDLEKELEQRECDVGQLTMTNLSLKNQAEGSKMISQPDKELLSEVMKLRSLLREKEKQLEEALDYIEILELFIDHDEV